jgi:hypothetical protein
MPWWHRFALEKKKKAYFTLVCRPASCLQGTNARKNKSRQFQVELWMLERSKRSQIPLFRSLGTPAKDKRTAVFDAGHIVPRNEMIKETLDWLDRYLGPVR